MAKSSNHKSIKHTIIDKDNTTMIIAVSIAVFVVIFCLFAIRALIIQNGFQNRVIKEKKTALRVAKDNKSAVDELKLVYEAFEGETINVLGGAQNGTGPLDGDNAKITLDALPSEYDYPGLSSSIEKVLVEGGYQIKSIGGKEDGSLQSNEATDIPNPTTSTSSANAIIIDTSDAAKPLEIPYPFKIETSPDGALKLLQLLEKSIRPFYVDTLTIESQGQNVSVEVGLKTYYLPATGLNVTTKEVK